MIKFISLSFYLVENKMWLIILIIIVSLVYGLSMQGITCCNSGSLFALVRAIVEKKKLSINEFIKYTKYIDYAKVKGKYYSDRPPGVSFAAVPIHFFRGNVTLVSVISGILSAVLVYLITLQLVQSPAIAFSVGLIFAFCTIIWRYSTIFIIHPLSTFLVLLAVYGLFVNFPIILIGLILGIATIVEYTDFMYFFGIALTNIIIGNLSSLPLLIVGYVIGISPLLVYNARCFGSPFTTSYKYSAHFKWSNSFKTTFVTPMLQGMKGLLFFIKKKGGIGIPGGILTLSPVLIFGIIGYIFLPFHILILFLCLTVPIFLLVSKHKTWWAGGGGDHRYLTSMIPYLTIPIGLTIKNLSFLWPFILLFALISLVMVISKIIALTVSVQDLKKIDPTLLKKIRKRKLGILGALNFKCFTQLLALTFEGLFLRKVKLEKNLH